jgi:hypothetical protein
MPTALTIFLALVAGLVSVAGLILSIAAYRRASLGRLESQHAKLNERLASSTIQAEIDEVVMFLKCLERRRRRTALRIADLDEAFGPWFFPMVHGPHGVDPFLGHREFATVKSLYRAWSHYGRKHDPESRQFGSAAAKRWARQTNEQRAKTRILWHHEVQNTGSTLFFWRLRFEPSYDQDRILKSLDAICEDFGVTSYVAYELLGPHDILLRAWMSDPHKDSAVTLTPAERGSLGSRCSCIEHMTQRLCEHTTEESNSYFEVEKIYRHWWWMPRLGSEERKPKPGFQRDLDDLNVRKEVERVVNDYNTGEISRLGLWRSSVWWRYRRKNIVRRRRLHGGIKFATVVRAKPGHAAPAHSDREHPIFYAVKRARWIRDRSVYAGKGFRQENLGEAQFLILGRVRAINFGRIRKRVIKPILKDPISNDYAPPLTYVATGPDTMRRTLRDGLA